MIQAASQRTKSVFQAEATSLFFTATLAQVLHIQNPTFLTDNQVLAKVVDHQMLHWYSRDVVANSLQATSRSSVQNFHIKSDLNGIAHDCAKQVLRQRLDRPIFRCTNSAHSPDSCPVMLALQNPPLLDIRLQLCKFPTFWLLKKYFSQLLATSILPKKLI